MISIYTQNIIKSCSDHANPRYALSMKKYLKNKFEFYGIKAPLLREIAKPFLQKENLPAIQDAPGIANELWCQPQRELQHFAIELLKKYHKISPKEWIDLYEKLIIEKSWWDTVDAVAAWFVRNHFSKHPELLPVYTSKWMDSENMWLQRTCLIFQLKYKNQTDFELMKSFIIRLSDSKEFFIRKAIGWALREYSKTNPKKVMNFVSHHELAPLSYKEAIRNMPRS